MQRPSQQGSRKAPGKRPEMIPKNFTSVPRSSIVCSTQAAALRGFDIHLYHWKQQLPHRGLGMQNLNQRKAIWKAGTLNFKARFAMVKAAMLPTPLRRRGALRRSRPGHGCRACCKRSKNTSSPHDEEGCSISEGHGGDAAGCWLQCILCFLCFDACRRAWDLVQSIQGAAGVLGFQDVCNI